jgi:hypothetical protein
MEHWIDLHPYIADKVLIRPFSLKPSATLRPSYYLHNIHTNNRTSKQSSTLKFRVFWDVLPCSQVDVGQRFRGSYCLHHQGDEFL